MMRLENPAAAKPLIWGREGKSRWQPVRRLVCVLLSRHGFPDRPEGISFLHPYGVVSQSEAVIGENTLVMQQVTIGGQSAGRRFLVGDLLRGQQPTRHWS